MDLGRCEEETGMTITLSTVMFSGAIVATVFFTFGLVLGICVADGCRSKRTCRACRRSFVEHGFNSDGVEYACVRREG